MGSSNFRECHLECATPLHINQTMDLLLSPIKCQFFLAFFDCIIVFSPNADGHIWHVRTVLPLILKAGVTLNHKRGNFIHEKIDYLGHVVRPDNLELADHTTDAVCILKPPQMVPSLSSLPWIGQGIPAVRSEFWRHSGTIQQETKER